MSVYNGKAFLSEQLYSIKNQSIQVDEVICIDDCSTDNSVEIIKRFIETHKLNDRWKIIENTANKGWKKNFIDGIVYTSGDIVFFADQDDVWLPQKIEEYVKVFRDPSVNVVISPYIEWYGENIDLPSIKDKYIKLRMEGKYENFNITGSGCTQALRKEYYKNIKKYYVDGMAHDDFFRKISQIDGSLAVMQSASILRRFHGNNESKRRRTFNSSINDYMVGVKFIDKLYQYMEESNNLEAKDENDILLRKLRRGYLSRYKFFKTKNILYLFKTIFLNPEQYTRLRQIVGDIILVYYCK